MNKKIRKRLSAWNNQEEICDMYFSKKIVPSIISTRFKCSIHTIYKILKSNNITVKKYIPAYDNKKDIINNYNQGISISKISNNLNCSRRLITKILKKSNIKIRSQVFYLKREPPMKKYYLEEEKIIESYGKFSVSQLANKSGCSIDVIYNILNKHNIPRKDTGFFHRGKHLSSETEFKKGQMALEKHFNWKGGKSFEPYTPDFNKQFKEAIKERDNHTCQLCSIFEEDHLKLYGYKLGVHHIDYDKKNTLPQNCITLCNRDNILVNKDREIWTKHFQELLKKLYGYQYTEDQKIILDFTEVVNNGSI